MKQFATEVTSCRLLSRHSRKPLRTYETGHVVLRRMLCYGTSIILYVYDARLRVFTQLARWYLHECVYILFYRYILLFRKKIVKYTYTILNYFNIYIYTFNTSSTKYSLLQAHDNTLLRSRVNVPCIKHPALRASLIYPYIDNRYR